MFPHKIEKIDSHQTVAVFDFICEVFNEFIAPGYSAEGIDTFMTYIAPLALEDRIKVGGQALWTVKRGEALAGVIEMRKDGHICLLFVSQEHQRQGIAKALLQHSLEWLKRLDLDRPVITVNSSPYAVEIYKKLGFNETGPEQVKNGIRFTPMEARVK